jgi:hypothetical protein
MASASLTTVVAAAGRNTGVVATRTIGVKEAGEDVTLPSDSRGRLMYYLHSVCSVLDFHENDIDRFTDYRSYPTLNAADDEKLVDWCKKFNPDIMKRQAFIEVDAGILAEYNNKFYEISVARSMIGASATGNDAIVVGEKKIAIKSIMFHTSDWLSLNYYSPMRDMETRRTSVVSRTSHVGTTSATSTTPTNQYGSGYTTMDSCTITWFKTVGALLIVFGYLATLSCSSSIGRSCASDPTGSGFWAAFLWAYIYGPILVHASRHPSSIDAAAPFGVGLVACIFFTIHFFIVIVGTAQVGPTDDVSVEPAAEQS